MKTMLKRLIVVLLLVISAQGIAQTPFTEEFKKNLKERVDGGLHPAIVVAYIDGDKIQYYSIGVKSLKTKEPVNEHTVFEIGSITKTFTGIILADKVLKGELKLDDPLQKYLPEGVTAPTRNGQVITLMTMSNHTSALARMPSNFAPKNPNNPYADYTEEQMYAFLQTYVLPRDIGSQYEYSNYAQGLLGNVLAKKSGLSYEQLMIKVIAKPLGMNNTAIAFTPEMKKNLALGHAGNIEVENWDLSSLAGAGGIRSTTVDMAKYVSANLGVLKSDLYPAMQLSHKVTTAQGLAQQVGLGWHVMKSGGKEIIGHSGGTGGYRAYAGFIPSDKKGVVVMTNSATGIDDIGIHLLNPAVALKAVDKTIAVDSKILERYVGKYELMPNFVLTITRENDQLSAQATGQPSFPIFAKANNVFYYKVVEAQLTFNESNGAVESVTLFQGGQTITGKRLAN
jgi:D-alanyl-D-alanine-carboxypeptidase/D-alanyl-D-alanine-endopeptidase